MKSIASIFLVASLFAACAKDTPAPAPVGTVDKPVNINNPTQTFDPAGQTLLSTGTFVGSAAHPSTSGTAKLYDKAGKRTLVFENFKTDGGPDLRIYLAEDDKATNFVEVSMLSASGNFFTDVPASFNATKQRSVLIWCKQFSVLFGSAALK